MYLEHWRVRVAELVNGAPFVALMSWASSPADESNRRAWLLYRDGEDVYVQERLFVAADHQFELDEFGCVVATYPRDILSDDGTPISEWRTSLAALRSFLAT